MIPGNIRFILLLILFFFHNSFLLPEDRITSTPLINLDELKPSFEDVEDSNNNSNGNIVIKKRKKLILNNNLSSARLIGLDKITAKTSKIIINLGETKKFGPLEIKLLKCGKVKSENVEDNVAYLQVKDISKNENDKVYIFNGWTFSSDPTIAPFDHAIYDLQLITCNNV
jgi:hypothetical protein